MTDPTTKTLCELCGRPTTSDMCTECPTLTTAEIIELAHKTIASWKCLLTAAAINNGGSISMMPWQLLQAEKNRLIIESTPWNVILIKAETLPFPPHTLPEA